MKPRRQHSLAATVVLAAALALAACGGDDDSDDSSTKTFSNDAYPFTFEYPGSLEETTDVSVNQNLGSGSTNDNVALGLDESNLILLQHATLNAQVTSDNLGAVKKQFDQLVGQADQGASGTVGETGGFPSLTYQDVPAPSVQDGQSQITFLFDGENEYVINCQSTPDHRDELSSACDQALSSLTRS